MELVRSGAYAAALPLLRRVMAGRNPGFELRLALAKSHFQLGDIHAALRELRRAARGRDPNGRRAALGKIAVYLPFDPVASNAQILKARRTWARLEAKAESSSIRRPARSGASRQKLRIGYVSAFFAFRNWMKLVWGTLDAHDRRSFEIHLFLDRGLPDRRHGYVPHGSDRVHALDNLSNEAAAKRIAAAKIDVLVDLNAYSYPSRLGLFFHKPAPIQVGWFNTNGTSGIEAFDYAIADPATVPAREERFYSERIVRIRGSYLAFSVSYRVPKVVEPPCARTGRMTFGCLAPQYKFTDEVIATFASILRAVPSAQLLLKNACLAHPSNRAAIRARFLGHGIAEDQLLCEGPAEHFAFLKTYDRIDVALDTFPYSGGNTTMEALWQGVPVLTFPGDRWVSRTSTSLLRAAGLGEWVCPSRHSFLRRAIALARSPDSAAQLSRLRGTLRKKLRASPACDTRGMCRQLEGHYSAMAGMLRDDPTSPREHP